MHDDMDVPGPEEFAAAQRPGQEELQARLLAWRGFQALRYTQVPDDFFDVLLPLLSNAEMRVLLYVMRHTFGWKKISDSISRSQMEHGIVKRDGTRLDGGTGLSSRGVRQGIKGLLDKGILLRQRHIDPDTGAWLVSTYSPRFIGEG